eukprot:6088452-Lingulodinium_polyedra.AAC.1
MSPAPLGGRPRRAGVKVPVEAWRLRLAPCRAKLPRQVGPSTGRRRMEAATAMLPGQAGPPYPRCEKRARPH